MALGASILQPLATEANATQCCDWGFINSGHGVATVRVGLISRTSVAAGANTVPPRTCQGSRAMPLKSKSVMTSITIAAPAGAARKTLAAQASGRV